MKSFSTLIVLKRPPELLFDTLRDRLSEIAPSIADISAIEELERDSDGDGVLVVNRWRARQAVPGFLRAQLGASEIAWIDRARWFRDDLVCHWSIEPAIADGAIGCSGATRFAPAMAGRGARVTFEGSLTIAPDFMASIVGGFEAPVRSLVESIATTLVPANFRAAAAEAVKLC
jgi:hypothetical protein